MCRSKSWPGIYDATHPPPRAASYLCGPQLPGARGRAAGSDDSDEPSGEEDGGCHWPGSPPGRAYPLPRPALHAVACSVCAAGDGCGGLGLGPTRHHQGAGAGHTGVGSESGAEEAAGGRRAEWEDGRKAQRALVRLRRAERRAESVRAALRAARAGPGGAGPAPAAAGSTEESGKLPARAEGWTRWRHDGLHGRIEGAAAMLEAAAAAAATGTAATVAALVTSGSPPPAAQGPVGHAALHASTAAADRHGAARRAAPEAAAVRRCHSTLPRLQCVAADDEDHR